MGIRDGLGEIVEMIRMMQPIGWTIGPFWRNKRLGHQERGKKEEDGDDLIRVIVRKW
jgi:hypothetical protein